MYVRPGTPCSMGVMLLLKNNSACQGGAEEMQSVHYLRNANPKNKMLNKILLFVLLVVTNISLYYFVVILEPQVDYRAVFIVVRAMLVTSMLMQLLTATGFMKEEKLW